MDTPKMIWAKPNYDGEFDGMFVIDGYPLPPSMDSGAFKYVRADLHDALRRRVAELEAALRGLLEPFDDEPCRYDHHGYCQEHFVEPGDRCCVKLAREALDAADIRAMKGGGE